MRREELLAPLSGEDDTFEVVDEAIGVLGLRRGLWMGDGWVVIHLLASVIEQAERFLPQLVAEARAEGCGWEEIGWLLGTDAEQARLRFDPGSCGRGYPMGVGRLGVWRRGAWVARIRRGWSWLGRLRRRSR